MAAWVFFVAAAAASAAAAAAAAAAGLAILVCAISTDVHEQPPSPRSHKEGQPLLATCDFSISSDVASAVIHETEFARV